LILKFSFRITENYETRRKKISGTGRRGR
jgi:hypothetical protein